MRNNQKVVEIIDQTTRKQEENKENNLTRDRPFGLKIQDNRYTPSTNRPRNSNNNRSTKGNQPIELSIDIHIDGATSEPFKIPTTGIK